MKLALPFLLIILPFATLAEGEGSNNELRALAHKAYEQHIKPKKIEEVVHQFYMLVMNDEKTKKEFLEDSDVKGMHHCLGQQKLLNVMVRTMSVIVTHDEVQEYFAEIAPRAMTEKELKRMALKYPLPVPETMKRFDQALILSIQSVMKDRYNKDFFEYFEIYLKANEPQAYACAKQLDAPTTSS